MRQAEASHVAQHYEIYAVVGENVISNVDLDYFAKTSEILSQKEVKKDAKLLGVMINAHLASVALQRLELQLSEQELNAMIKKIEEEYQQHRNINISKLLSERGVPFSDFKKVINLQVSGEKLFKMSESFQQLSKREKGCYAGFGLSNYAVMRTGEIGSILTVNEMFGVEVSKIFHLREDSVVSFWQLMVRKDLLTNALLMEIAQQYKKSHSIDEVVKYIENVTPQAETDAQFPRVIANEIKNIEAKALFKEYAQNIAANPVVGMTRPFLRDEYVVILRIEEIKNARMQDIKEIIYPLSFCNVTLDAEEENFAEAELKREKGFNTFTAIMEVKKDDTFVFLTEAGMKLK
ncbi:hypothetical protein Fsol_00756 [Candidatus Fokinia solitaria]|uniref:Uncharacterized protein n=1 Tax=Candidatus Fokinia solitaria TaxID=1802984 RepID=A0A2U8BT61_9RICK|nr:hypothetical protein Fsol_00756 [Candidatus Fokinia solitaria]